MGLEDNLRSEVRKTIQEGWTRREQRRVPQLDDLKLSNDAVTLEGTVLYADLDDSTKLVESMAAEFAAHVYKSYLACAARIVRSENGVITAYDGDRIMAVYAGGKKEDRAARTALKINFAVQEIVNPAIRDKYPTSVYSVRHVVAIDTSELFVARIGIRGFNELVWVWRAANHAAKLSCGPVFLLRSLPKYMIGSPRKSHLIRTASLCGDEARPTKSAPERSTHQLHGGHCDTPLAPVHATVSGTSGQFCSRHY